MFVGQPKVGGAMRHQGIELGERSLVEEQLEALARGQLAAPVLLLDALLSAPESCLGPQPLQARNLVGR
jgi:hypothetical protein